MINHQRHTSTPAKVNTHTQTRTHTMSAMEKLWEIYCGWNCAQANESRIFRFQSIVMCGGWEHNTFEHKPPEYPLKYHFYGVTIIQAELFWLLLPLPLPPLGIETFFSVHARSRVELR